MLIFGAKSQIYAKHRQSLSRRLFLAKCWPENFGDFDHLRADLWEGNDSLGFPFRPIFVDAQVKVHDILRSLTFTRALLKYEDQGR